MIEKITIQFDEVQVAKIVHVTRDSVDIGCPIYPREFKFVNDVLALMRDHNASDKAKKRLELKEAENGNPN